jgi:hypothetical protein
MIQFAVLAGLLLVSAPDEPRELASRIVSAHIYRPGLVFLVREVTIPAGRGSYRLDVLPEVLDGSLWYEAAEGATLSDLTTVLRLQERSFDVEAETIPELLAANVGRRVKIWVAGPAGARPSALEGTVANFQLPQGVLTLRLDSGNVRSVPLNLISELAADGLKTTIERQAPVPVQHISFQAEAARPASIRFASLETGAIWTASYRLELLSSASARLEAKGQLGLAGLRFEDTEVVAMAGLPRLSAGTKVDLASGLGPLAAYVNNTQSRHRAHHPAPGDPYDSLPQLIAALDRLMQSSAAAQPYYGGPGGFGGGMGGGTGGGAIDFITFDSTDSSTVARPGVIAPETSPQQMEDLYAYPFGKLSLAPGDRLTRVLFQANASYERLLVWTNETNVVHSTLRVRNETKMPWTGGKCMVMMDGAPLAQVEMPFTALNDQAELTIGTAQDVVVDRDVVEVSRRSLPPHMGRVWTEVTLRATFTARNLRTEPARLDLRVAIDGEVTEAAGAKVTVRPNPRSPLNPRSEVVWSTTLAPGEEKTFTALHKTIQ